MELFNTDIELSQLTQEFCEMGSQAFADNIGVEKRTLNNWLSSEDKRISLICMLVGAEVIKQADSPLFIVEIEDDMGWYEGLQDYLGVFFGNENRVFMTEDEATKFAANCVDDGDWLSNDKSSAEYKAQFSSKEEVEIPLVDTPPVYCVTKTSLRKIAMYGDSEMNAVETLIKQAADTLKLNLEQP